MATGFDVAGFRFADYGELGPQTVAGHPQEWLGGRDIEAAKSKVLANFNWDNFLKEQCVNQGNK